MSKEAKRVVGNVMVIDGGDATVDRIRGMLGDAAGKVTDESARLPSFRQRLSERGVTAVFLTDGRLHLTMDNPHKESLTGPLAEDVTNAREKTRRAMAANHDAAVELSRATRMLILYGIGPEVAVAIKEAGEYEESAREATANDDRDAASEVENQWLSHMHDRIVGMDPEHPGRVEAARAWRRAEREAFHARIAAADAALRWRVAASEALQAAKATMKD